MLTQIHICNLITIQKLQIDVPTGFIVITGETGAGKSILIDAIELALGGRGGISLVRNGQEKLDVTLNFDVLKNQKAQAWLDKHELTESGECIIRRTISIDGRSKSYINGFPCTLQSLRELCELLLNIHSQHEHHTLLKPDNQRDILDHYAGHDELANKVSVLSHEWHRLSSEIFTLTHKTEERISRSDFLKFQLQEFEELHIQPNEFEKLDKEYKQLANADELLQYLNQSLNDISTNEEGNALKSIHQAIHSLENVKRFDSNVSTWIDSLNSALILINDVENDLYRYLDSVDIDPDKLQKIENRMSQFLNLSRKHRTEPQELLRAQEKLATEYATLESSDEHLINLKKQLDEVEKNYLNLAKKLSDSRKKVAKKLEKEITDIIRTLSLPHSIFQISFENEKANSFLSHGLEKVIFQIQTNMGQTLQPLHKVVSGGELSRISLAIHMATATQHTISTLVFDEVDVGIGGGTAETVGKLLQRLGNTHQILCITHQPQVAAQGQHHLKVKKHQNSNTTLTEVTWLGEEEKVDEVARMLGGIEITNKTLAHAKELLERSLT